MQKYSSLRVTFRIFSEFMSVEGYSPVSIEGSSVLPLAKKSWPSATFSRFLQFMSIEAATDRRRRHPRGRKEITQ